MPFINFDATATSLIDANLSLSFTQLSDLLRVLIEQVNSHEQRMQDLNAQVLNLQRRNEELEKQVKQKDPTVGSTVNEALDELSNNLQLLRGDVHELKKRSHDSDNVQSELENLARNVASDRQSTSVAFSTVQEKWTGLNHGLTKCQTDVALALGFQDAWGASAESITRLQREHVGPDGKKDFILALPAMTSLLEIIEGGNAARNQSGAPAPGDFIQRADWDAVINSLRGDLSIVQQALVDAQRVHRLAEGTDGKLKEIDEKLRVLDATKADHFSLTGKTDKDTTTNIAQKLNALTDAFGELAERVHGGAGATSSGADAAQQKRSVTAAATDDIRKRLTAVETEVTNLEGKKADRSELMKLYEAMDALTRHSPLGLQTMPSSHEGSPQPPKVKSPSAKSRSSGSLLDQVAVVDSHLPPVDLSTVGTNRIGSASPRRGSTPSRPLFVGRTAVGVRDSSGGMTPASLTCVSR
jgi:cell division septum initiation protein DivIVA